MLPLLLLAATVATPPKPVDPATWITADDYPPEAMRQGWEGVTAFRLSIDAGGKVTDCAITTSSGHDPLDQKTCELMKARAKFQPGLTAKGKPIAATFDRKVRWQIPQPQLPPGAIHSVYVQGVPGGGTECLVEGSIYAKLTPEACQATIALMQKQGLALPNSISVFVPNAAIILSKP